MVVEVLSGVGEGRQVVLVDRTTVYHRISVSGMSVAGLICREDEYGSGGLGAL